jgi:MOSC domain-containing protein YiiM
MEGRIESIHVAPEATGPVESRESVEAIEREAGIELEPGEHRRNITTAGVALNHLVGERFRVGDVVCLGVRLCEPCNHLESLTSDGVVAALTHRGGLRADIEESGAIRVGDTVERVE